MMCSKDDLLGSYYVLHNFCFYVDIFETCHMEKLSPSKLHVHHAVYKFIVLVIIIYVANISSYRSSLY